MSRSSRCAVLPRRAHHEPERFAEMEAIRLNTEEPTPPAGWTIWYVQDGRACSHFIVEPDFVVESIRPRDGGARFQWGDNRTRSRSGAASLPKARAAAEAAWRERVAASGTDVDARARPNGTAGGKAR